VVREALGLNWAKAAQVSGMGISALALLNKKGNFQRHFLVDQHQAKSNEIIFLFNP
jgi:hypothetical protein